MYSALSLPLQLAEQVVGAINLARTTKHVFGDRAAELGELFAKPAAVAVHNAQILSDAIALTVQLQTALSTRPVIDQAIGLIRGRTGRSAEDAFAQLRAISQSEHRKLAEVAHNIVEEAARRAQARPQPTRLKRRSVTRRGDDHPGPAPSLRPANPTAQCDSQVWPKLVRSAFGSARDGTLSHEDHRGTGRRAETAHRGTGRSRLRRLGQSRATRGRCRA